ncbi:ankyrin repeat and zinc finger domain-containing protein 1-like isoform X1 [Amphibalanus amphitrite]|nr:ankyrin repeat and zinc finger domain-containing protein 1-like isoform X1 [Amphibalanus amphitrite]
MRLKVEQPIAPTSGTLCAPKLQGTLRKSMADNTESNSNGQTAVKGPGKSTAESSKPITMFLHQEDRIRELFKGLKIADCSRLNASIEEEDESAELDNVPRDPLVVSEVMTCSHCGVGFSDRPEQVGHYKSDFHKYNVKRSAGGQTALTERQFDRLDIDDDVLSLSGSDSEEDSDEDTLSEREEGSTSASASEETPARRRRRRRADGDRELQRNQLRRHTKLFLVNADRQMFCLYKCLIMSKWAPAGDTQVELAVKQLARGLRVGVFLLSGGHFAAAVFSGGKAVLHKTFHSYTVRAKQGGGQASRDARSATKQPRSAGASLRRYNEASLVQHIQELLASWEEEVSRCSLLFVRALGSGAAALYGGKAPPLNRRDPRIRSVPFPTRRPTFAELERVYQALTCVHVYGTDVDVNLSQVPQSPPKPETPARTPRRSPRPERPPAERTGPPTAPPPGRRITARDRRNSERQQDLERSLSVTDSEGSDSEMAEYEVRQMRGLTDLSSFSPEEGFDSSRPLDDRVVTAVEERRRRREFRRRLREEQRAAEVGETQGTTDNGQQTAAPSTTDAEPPEPKEPAGAEEFRVQCYTLCKTGDAAGLDALLTEPLVPLTALLSRSFGQTSQTLLHAAARAGHSALVSRLLEVGADPTLRDGAGQTPYDVSSARETRNQFRRYRAAHPDKHNYAKAHIPAPLTEEMEAEKKQRDAEKKKLQNQKRKEKMKEKKAQQLIEEAARKEKEKEEEEKRRFLQLSDREKRALAAERRMAAQQSGRALVRCCHCGEDITGRVPFEYSGRLLCSTACVRQHRAATAGAGTAA